jgi:ABC-type Fe3+-hydroxamate transport system substrate-binding protein
MQTRTIPTPHQSSLHAVRAAGPLLAAALVAVLGACGSTSRATDGAATTAPSATAAGSAGPASSPTPAAGTTAGASTSTGAVTAFDPANPDTTIAGTFPVTVKVANGPVTLASSPKKIVSLSPSATEMLYAIGAGPQVVAVDDQSSYPTSAPRTKLSGFQPNAEAVAGYSPDLVVLSSDSNGLMASLTKLKIPALLLPAATSLDDAYSQEQALGEATGHPVTASLVVDRTKSRIAAAVASLPASAKGRKVYHELDPKQFYSATSSTFIGSIYKNFGLTDIADTAKGAAAAGGYPQLSAEFVVTQAPDLIVLADTKCCNADLASLARRPAFAAIPAVKNAKVLAVDDDIASRWGPRIADFAEALAKVLQS